MSMLEEHITVKTVNGKFFDLFDKSSSIFISDYSHLKHEIVVDASNANVKIGEEHKKTAVSSIDEMKRVFEELIPAVIQELNEAFSVDIIGFSLKYSDWEKAVEGMSELGDIHIQAEGSQQESPVPAN